MPVDDYALGQEIEGGTVSWWLEFKTRAIASMSGGSASKHLIFRSRSDGAWRYPRSYGSVTEAWAAVRAGFVEAFKLASEHQFDEIDDITAIRGAAALRVKALYMYFPAELVPVCSKTHINHFLRRLGEEASQEPVVRANRDLLEHLQSLPELAGLGTQELGYFLYHWADPRSTARVVKIAPGERARFWQDCLDGGYICVGWDEVGDLSQFESKEAFRQAFADEFPYDGNQSQVTRKSNELWTLMDLEPGDRVVVNRGISEVLAVGTVNDEGYLYRDDRPEYRHTLGVDWDTSFARTIEPIRAWATTTVKKVPATLFQRITGDTPEATRVEVDSIYAEIEAALQRRGQVILYGPPGTGKTYVASRAAVWLLEGGSTHPGASALLSNPEALAARAAHHSSGRGQAQRVWFMVANPSNWAWSQLFSDGSVDYSLGRLRRNYERVAAGDLVVGYESTPTKRVVALARVTTEYDPDAPPEAAISLEPIHEIADGVTYDELRSDPVLSESEPAQFRCQGTLFALSTVEADRMLSLVADRDPRLDAYAAPGVQRLTRVTFHPSYTYEDFVEGFRPTPSATRTGLQLSLVDGVFKEVCLAAAADPEHTYLLLIDEINRGNIPKIFGELITLIEMDKRSTPIQLPQSGVAFSVPSNLQIIGTMNTADRSIHLLDAALRRRFAFLELLPDAEVLEGSTAGPLALDTFLETLNDRIRERVGREKQVGHAIFFENGSVIDTPEAFAAMFRQELLPLVQEYLYEDYRELEALLGPVIDSRTQRPSAHLDDPEELCALLAEQLGATADT
jgi:5-methylcytosine-specific restriction protein B